MNASTTINNNNNNRFSLNDSNNYICNLTNTIGDIVNKYNTLLVEYLNFIVDNISVKNSEYSKFIIERGIETITHVFTMLLYYSRNVDMAYYHGQRSFYFYVEFIGQISEDQHTFLNLSSRDAAMFVYKKTIFELSTDYRKNITEPSKDTIEKLDTLNVNINIFKNIIFFTLQEMKITEKNAIIGNLVKHMESMCNKLLKYKFTIQEYNTIENFVSLMSKNVSITKYYELVDLFIQKYSKIKPESANKISDARISEKFTDPLCESKLEESSEKFIKWILA
jgi:hypothetical protein